MSVLVALVFLLGSAPAKDPTSKVECREAGIVVWEGIVTEINYYPPLYILLPLHSSEYVVIMGECLCVEAQPCT